MPTALQTALRTFLAPPNPATSDDAADALGTLLDTYTTAGALATTGASVNVAASAPPAAGNVLTATDATHATWQAPSGAAVATMTQWMWAQPFMATTSDSTGAANRIKTRSIVTPAQISLANFRIKVNGSGGGADLCGFGIYNKATKALIARTAATASLGWGPGIRTIAVNGGAVTLPAGEYVLAWTSSGANLTLIVQGAYNSTWNTWDDADGYDSAVSVAGVLPAALNGVYTPDNSRGFPWIALRA